MNRAIYITAAVLCILLSVMPMTARAHGAASDPIAFSANCDGVSKSANGKGSLASEVRFGAHDVHRISGEGFSRPSGPHAAAAEQTSKVAISLHPGTAAPWCSADLDADFAHEWVLPVAMIDAETRPESPIKETAFRLDFDLEGELRCSTGLACQAHVSLELEDPDSGKMVAFMQVGLNEALKVQGFRDAIRIKKIDAADAKVLIVSGSLAFDGHTTRARPLRYVTHVFTRASHAEADLARRADVSAAFRSTLEFTARKSEVGSQDPQGTLEP